MNVSKTYNLRAVNPGLASQWHPVKNGDLKTEDVTPGSHKKVWWICEEGHEWEKKIYSRTGQKTGCPYCFHKSAGHELTISNPELAELWHPKKNVNLTPVDVTAN